MLRPLIRRLATWSKLSRRLTEYRLAELPNWSMLLGGCRFIEPPHGLSGPPWKRCMDGGRGAADGSRAGWHALPDSPQTLRW
jgi:hypothetical protein